MTLSIIVKKKRLDDDRHMFKQKHAEERVFPRT